jgi:hypothetical protein
MFATYREALDLVGLSHVATDWNCTALELVHSDEAYTLITRTDSPMAPESLEDPVTVWFHGETEVAPMEFPTLRDAILDLVGPIAQ